MSTFEKIIEVNPRNLRNFDNLCKQMKQNNVIPLIGAGMSKPHYPIWSKFLEDLTKLIPSDDTANKLLSQGLFDETLCI